VKTILLTLLLCVSIPSSKLNEIRRSFKNASDNKENAETFYELVQSKEYSDEMLYTAYDGASEIILSKYLGSNLEKLKYFNQGSEKIDAAVEADASNTEIRFIRLVIQMNTPKFLNYYENIHEDKEFLISHYPECSSSVRKMISEYASMSDSFSTEEKTQLK
jgi:hypothetical protein